MGLKEWLFGPSAPSEPANPKLDENSTAPEMIARVAIEPNAWELTQHSAIRKLIALDEQALITRVALESTSNSVRVIAVLSIKDPAEIAKFAVEDPWYGVRVNATGRLTDKNLLTSIAAEDPDEQVRYAAARALTCPGCMETFNLKRKVNAGVYFGDALLESIGRTPYRCRGCNVLMCMTCVKVKACPACRGIVFDAATNVLLD